MEFADRATEDLYNGASWAASRRLVPPDVRRRGLEKLDSIAYATCLDDLRFPPGNRLEALKGDRAGRHSIRINDQYRVCFRWTDAGPVDVEIVDYH